MSARILLADDHEIFVEALCSLLDGEPDFEVVGKVTDGSAAVEVARERKPDVVVMDLSMPGMSGVEATRLITGERPATRVLCLSMHADRGFVMGALDAGASGYVLKDGAKTELLHAIRSVLQDRVYMSPCVAAMVVDSAKSGPSAPALSRLTERECEILRLLVQGESTRDIAAQLHVSVKTVGTHRVHIMDKLDLHSVAALTKFAIREGLASAAD